MDLLDIKLVPLRLTSNEQERRWFYQRLSFMIRGGFPHERSYRYLHMMSDAELLYWLFECRSRIHIDVGPPPTEIDNCDILDWQHLGSAGEKLRSTSQWPNSPPTSVEVISIVNPEFYGKYRVLF